MKDIKKFLAELSKEMQRGEDFDIDARQVLDELHNDAAKIEESGNSYIQPMRDRLSEFESKFAANHPGLERAARELADALAKMGI